MLFLLESWTEVKQHRGAIFFSFFTPVATVGAGNVVAISFLTEGLKKQSGYILLLSSCGLH